MGRLRVCAVACATVLLAACGGGGDEPADPTPTPTKAAATTPEPAPTPTIAQAAGTPAPESLSRLRCAEAKKGWTASGYVSNPTKQAASFQVTVYVGPPDGELHDAVTKRLENVAAGGSVEFELAEIPAAEGDCHVQVLRLDQ